MIEEWRSEETVEPVPEDVGRANLYALIGRLFYSPPDENLLSEICRGGEAAGGAQDGRGLIAAWRSLQEACRATTPEVVREEYHVLFVGVGRAEVTPYLSAYAEPSAPDHHLLRLRQQLSAWGLARRDNAFEIEDHISGVSDVMRFLIERHRLLADQQRFFVSFVYAGAIPFFAAVQQTPSALFFKSVGAFAQAFFEVEKAAFEMFDQLE